MTVSSLTTKNSYSGNGSTSAFSYTFKIFDDDDVTVIIRTDSTGTETVKTKTTHYTVSGVGSSSGGTITFTSGNIPASGETVLLLRNTPLTQATDYTPNAPFPAATHEDALDKLTLIGQDTQEEVDRSIKLSRANTMTSTEFTVPAATRANKIFAFDGSGELAVTQEIGTFKGDWAASTAYAVRDLVKDTSTNNIFIVNEAHTSSGSQPLTTNANSAKYDLIVDAATATSAQTAAASSASSASASASTATTKAAESASSATAASDSATAAAASAANAAAVDAAGALPLTGGTMTGALTVTTADNTPQITLTSTDTDANSGPEFLLFRNSASPADDDQTGHVQFAGKNDAAETIAYAEIDSLIRDASDGTEDGELRLNVRRGGTLRAALQLGPDYVIFNEGGEDINVRMESDSNTSMFFLDGGNNTIGIGTDTASNPLTVRGDGGTGATAALRIRDESNQGATLGIQNDGDCVLVCETKDFNINTTGGNVRVEDGNLVIGTSGKGIDFSATANSAGSMGSELLDDYEEGDWTPTGTASSGSAPTFSTASGTYTKIGRLVTVNANITNITVGDTANAIFQVSSLPFTPDQADCYGACTFGHVTISTENGQVAMADASTNRIIFFMNRSDAGRTNIDNQHITSTTSDLQFTVSYMSDQ